MDLSLAQHEHLADLRARSCSKHTLVQYEMVGRRFATWAAGHRGRATTAELTPANVRAFLGWLEAEHTDDEGKQVHHGPKSLGSHIVVLKALATFLTREGLYPRGNPLQGVRVPKAKLQAIPRFSPQEVATMLRLAGATAYPVRNRAILALLYETGVRVSELCDLTTAEVILASGQAAGRALIHGKGAKTRHVYFGTRCSYALAEYLASDRRRDAAARWVFLARTGEQMTRSLIDHLIKEVGKLAGIEGVRLSAHTFRHTMATNYLKANPGQLVQLQRLLGHSTATMTLHYARLSQDDVEGSYRSLLDGMADAGVIAAARPLEDGRRRGRRPAPDQEPPTSVAAVLEQARRAVALPRGRRGAVTRLPSQPEPLKDVI